MVRPVRVFEEAGRRRGKDRERKESLVRLMDTNRGMVWVGPDWDKRSPARAAGSACEGSQDPLEHEKEEEGMKDGEATKAGREETQNLQAPGMHPAQPCVKPSRCCSHLWNIARGCSSSLSQPMPTSQKVTRRPTLASAS